MKSIKAHELRKKSGEELLSELKKFREELQNIRFTKVSGTAVSKLSKIKILRKSIARCLTVINNNKKTQAIEALRKRKTTDEAGNAVERVVKNIKTKHLPTNLRPKKTRAIRRALTKSQSRKVNIRILKKRLNFPKRKFAVPVSK
jgi:large subunit ribosomal protein L35e